MKKNGTKSRLLALFICFQLIFLSGCANAQPKSIEDPMVIYCMEATERIVEYYLTRFLDFHPGTKVVIRAFSDAREMDEVLVHELNVGIGPDVVIFNDETELDVLRMAKNGAFIPLDNKIAADAAFNPDDYIKSALDAGQADGSQYILPLTFTVPFVMYDADGDLGFTPAPVISHSDFMNSVIAGIESSKSEQNAGNLYVSNFGGNVWTNDLISPMLLTSQVLKLSEKNKVENFDEKSFRQVVDWLKIYINECYPESEALTDARGEEPWDIAQNINYFYYYAPLNFIHRLWYYNSCYGYADIDHFGFSALSEVGSDNVVAMLVSYGVVGNNAHPLSYEFLRAAMDAFVYSFWAGRNRVYLDADEITSSVNLANIEMMIATRTWGPKFDRMSDNSVFVEKPLDEELIDRIRQIFLNINNVIIPNVKLDNVFRDSFTAYFENEKSYEDCADNFLEKLNLYLSE